MPGHASAARGSARDRSELVALAIDRPVPRRAHGRSVWRRAETKRVLHGAGQRWRVEDRGLRPHMGADLRRPAHGVGRRARGRAVGSADDLRGKRRGLHRPDLSVGDGMYRSRDGGRTWKHLGLHDAQQIAAIAVDPRDARRLFVAAAGHPYGPNGERGIFRSLDGGETFDKVLYKDDNTGGATSPSIRGIRRSSTRRCGSRAKVRGRTATGKEPAAASTSPSTGARRGSS